MGYDRAFANFTEFSRISHASEAAVMESSRRDVGNRPLCERAMRGDFVAAIAAIEGGGKEKNKCQTSTVDFPSIGAPS
jgi:hypothetical protein